MTRITLIFSLFLPLLLIVPSGAAEEDDPTYLVGQWLEENELAYAITENGEIILAFQGENVSQIDVDISFSEEFIYFLTPVGVVPDDIGDNFFFRLIDLTTPIPMVKPSIDEDRFLSLVIDLPLSAISREQVIKDIALLVELIDNNYQELHPWVEEE
jgi:hypothetical protein